MRRRIVIGVVAVLGVITGEAFAQAPVNRQQFQFERSALDTAKALGLDPDSLGPLREGKERLNEQQLTAFANQFGVLPNGMPTLQIAPGKSYVLIPLTDLDKVADLNRESNAESVRSLPPLKKGKSSEGAGAGGMKVDHRPNQSPIRDQQDRGTCVAHAACAELEAIEKAQGRDLDLSENLAYLRFMDEEGSRPCLDPGLATWKAAEYLKKHLVCQESKWPYVGTLATCSLIDTAPAAVFGSPGFGIQDYVHLPPSTEINPDGTIDIRDTKTLEKLLTEGHDIVFGTVVAWRNSDQHSEIIDVTLGVAGQPIFGFGGHAMLIVGFDQTGPKPYFIVKNSWGPGFGQAGYYRFTYDYIRTYAKYGYVTKTMRNGNIPAPAP
jgi:hypothetical protein